MRGHDKMKKFSQFITGSAFILLISGCFGTEEFTMPSEIMDYSPYDIEELGGELEEQAAESEEEVEIIENDDGSLTIETEEGDYELMAHEDGSLTVTMSASRHQEQLNNYEEMIEEEIQQIRNSEEAVFIEDVQTNETFSEYTLLVDQELYENLERDSELVLEVLQLFAHGFTHQVLDGVDKEDYEITLLVKDKDTRDVLDEYDFSEEMFEDG
ncbi:hypothetical protein HUG15_00385 [Salicibibacter cibarius]|uniref:Uncharacterized protein n=1 Tax=Salicibibacter cibarius TaxID=2743000 RepID=A0A7T6Z039_9BACI|nr:hypothetical protein [Salicibibacter cibarius]QQK74226.1 hypothetical protein HUG15_00385 [Salicibibacter cibarius]